MLKARLLGQFAIHLDDEPVEIRSRPAQSLLAYLMLHAGQAQRREWLAGLFWPDSSESNARNNLRYALWRVRQGIGGAYIKSDKVWVTFDADADYWLDTAVLQAEPPADLSVDRLIEIVSVHQGELLPGFYDEWVAWERERLQAVYEARMGLLVQRLLTQERWQETCEWAERWIAGGQVSEPAYRALMLAHASLSDQARVAAVYQRCVQALDEELGVEPSAETLQLYNTLTEKRELTPQQDTIVAQVAAQENMAGQEPLHGRHRPAPWEVAPVEVERPGFVARERELAWLDGYLEQALDGQGQVVFVTGGPGRGKTSLLGEDAAGGPIVKGHDSRFAGHFLERLVKKSKGQVLNRSELITGAIDAEFDKRFGLEPEWVAGGQGICRQRGR